MHTPSRIVLARKRRALTQKELADAIGMSPRSVIAYEKGEQELSQSAAYSISLFLNFPIDFFYLKESPSIEGQNVSFRALSRLSARQREASLAVSSLALDFHDAIQEKFKLPICALPDLRDVEPETAAYLLRNMWGLGNNPISNLMHLLESKGVRVFSLCGDSKDLDAYCFWRDGIPFIFVNIDKSSERVRFDLAHELAHLVLHRHATVVGRDAENEADLFASSFLMPRASMLAFNPLVKTFGGLVEFKVQWGVSLAALCFRLHKLDLISDWQYRSICISMAKKGYNKSEPYGIAMETSQVVDKIVSYFRTDNIFFNRIVKKIGLSKQDMNSFLFQKLLVSLEGEGSSTLSRRRNTNLTLIRS